MISGLKKNGENISDRNRRQGQGYEAYLTVYLALVMAVILSLCLTLIEGSRQNAIYMEAECVTDIGLNSVLAEYHRELFRQYNLFAVDTSYRTATPRVRNMEERLEFYLEKNVSHDDIFLDWLLYRDLTGMRMESGNVAKARMLTDENGGVFRRRAAEAAWDDANLTLFEELNGWMEIVESKELTERDIAAEKRKYDKKLDSYEGEKQISETEWITIKVSNPTDHLEKLRKKGVLAWAVRDTSLLSDKSLSAENLIASRIQAGMYNQGNMERKEDSQMDSALERFCFQEYLLDYMGYYGAEKPDASLAYQVEYVLAGKPSDTDNLKYVVDRIFAVREAANASYLYSDQKKSTVAEGLGSALAVAMGIPEASHVMKHILILGWAFAESLYDIQCLMDGGRIPLIKTQATWHFDLSNALKIKTILSDSVSDSVTEGLSYADYLRIFLTITKEDDMTMRAMNMVEADIRQTPGNDFFRLDGCVDAVEACVRMDSVYGYDCEITRQKGYSTQ